MPACPMVAFVSTPDRGTRGLSLSFPGDHGSLRAASPHDAGGEDIPAGLTRAEAKRRLDAYGPNAVHDAVRPAVWSFLGKLWGPIPWLLEAAIILQVGLRGYVEAAVIAALLLFNAALGFIQEGRANAAVARLKKRLAPNALVRRDGAWVRCPASELVPGNVIGLALGALVPADARVISGSLLVDKSMLTGESLPVESGLGSLLYASTLVRRGQAVAEVTATGAKTTFGRGAELIRIAHAPSTEQRAILAATRNLAIINFALAALIVAAADTMGFGARDLVRLALTALLATIPIALPATFTLSAAVGALALAARGVLVTRLTAVHEAAAMDILCADKTGTLTENALAVGEVVAMPGFNRERVLALAALASSAADQDPIDATIRQAGAALAVGQHLLRFVPFDPATRMSEADAIGGDGRELHIVKGAFSEVARIAEHSADATLQANQLAARGERVIAVAAGAPRPRLAGLIALSDPPRADSAGLVQALRELGVRTLMVTGDAPETAAAIARKVGIGGSVSSGDVSPEASIGEEPGIFARVLPEQKYRLVAELQHAGRVVGMCGDGANDGPALRQAGIGIAVSTATDVAKAAAGMVPTEPGLGGIVAAVREGRIAFQRLLSYTLNMLVKKIEIVMFLAIGLGLSGRAVLTPVLVALMFVTNDLLSMALTADRASPAPAPSRWNMRSIVTAGAALGLCKLAFSSAVLVVGRFRLGLGAAELQTLAFATLVFGNQGTLFVLRERRHMWASKPSGWVLASSAAGIAFASALALSGTLMAPLGWHVLVTVFAAAVGFAVLLDQVARPIMAALKVE